MMQHRLKRASRKLSLWRVAAGCLALLSVASLGSAGWEIISARGDPSWPIAVGRVVASRYTGTFSPVPPSRAAGPHVAASVLRWDVTYEYTVGSNTYRGRDSTSQAIRPSDPVHVYYDVQVPSNSVLEPGVDGYRLAWSLVFAAFFMLARQFAAWRAGWDE